MDSGVMDVTSVIIRDDLSERGLAGLAGVVVVVVVEIGAGVVAVAAVVWGSVSTTG